jgi:hypothetical protein
MHRSDESRAPSAREGYRDRHDPARDHPELLAGNARRRDSGVESSEGRNTRTPKTLSKVSDPNNSAGAPGITPADPRCIYSRCPAEPVVYATKEECDVLFKAPCLKEWQAWNSCDLQNEQCDAKGKIIISSLAPCAQQKQDLSDCIGKQ